MSFLIQVKKKKEREALCVCSAFVTRKRTMYKYEKRRGIDVTV